MMITSLILSIETTLSQAVLSIPNYTRARVCEKIIRCIYCTFCTRLAVHNFFWGATLT